ncbi:MAG: PKD domain-containing protein [Bacteroidales bacterium]|nr:PKD domain-containing protein [Bacteroidales bacterium]
MIATAANGCTNNMNGSVDVNPLPVIYTITPTGNACSNTAIGLNGSEIGVNYVLVLNGVLNLDTISGPGGMFSFGVQPTTGTYTIYAYNVLTNCQANMNGSLILDPAPTAFNMTPAGIACVGTTIGLDNSEVGVSYQLRLDGITDIGAPVAGTGSAITFGVQTLTGNYTIVATSLNGCTTIMNGPIDVYSLPIAFTITPAGSNCVNTVIGLNGSEFLVDYTLLLNGTLPIATISGTGSAISFGPQPLPGTYTIVAINTSTNCQSTMNGTSIIKVDPLIFTMTPTGVACLGSALGLDDSETGITYQLRLNGSVNVGSPVTGTGSSISFGIPILPGTYTVVATSSNGCSTFMNGTVVLSPLPIAFTITPTGANCAGSSIGLNGSELNVNYVLVLNNTLYIDTIPGTGGTLNFGPQLTTGTYTILAYSVITNCQLVMNGSTTLGEAPIVFNITPAGISCVGASIGVDNTEIGVNYQLRRDGIFNVGSPIVGTGAAIDFGVQTLPGIYTVEADNGNGCIAVMNGNVDLQPLPTAFTLTPGGNQCPGTILLLNGSETGVDYILMRDGLFPMDTVSGTGSMISFGAPLIAGNYTVIAVSVPAGCISNMNGTTLIMTAPIAYNLTPAGINCVGSSIGVDDSEAGVNYQLIRNGIVNVGAAVPGTGSAISFGVVTIPGIYTVIATSTLNGCPTTMNGVADIQPSPLSFTIFPQGTQCAGADITLNGSELGVNYVLVIDGILNVDTLAGTGNVLNFGPQFTNGIYTILAVGGANSCQITMLDSCVVVPSPTLFNVTPAGVLCASAIVGLDGSENGIDYTLYKDGSSTGIILSGTGSAISFGLQSPGLFTVLGTDQVTGCSILMSGSADIEYLPTVNAGMDQSICSDLPVALIGTSSNTGTTIWISSGDGTFSDPTLLSSSYTLGAGDVASGSVVLVLQASGSGACSASFTSDTVLITITSAPTVNAGSDIDVCQPIDFTITTATASNYATLLWTTSGTGNFSASNSLSTIYIPSAADLTAGTVNLTLTVSGISPCMNVISDVVAMNFHAYMTASAGINDTICAGSNYTVSTATATNYSSVSWATTGSGSFTGGNTLNPTYYPSSFDITAGFVNLVMTAQPIAPCSVVISDTLILTITSAPAIFAGADVNICEGSVVSLMDASASAYSSLFWTSSGTGSFSNTGILNPTYTPSAGDILSGVVTLTLTINGNTPCYPLSDDKLVTITRAPAISAGPDTLICEGMSYSTASASASYFSNLIWSTSGTGSFTNGNLVLATYTPSVADIAAGSVVLTMTVDANPPCTGSVSDSFVLTINGAATAFAGPDASICNNIPFALGSATATNFASVLWTSTGTGSFTNPAVVNPVYIPSTADMLAGSVILTLTSNALPSCISVSDAMTLSITQLPAVNAGVDTHICSSPYTLTGTSSANVSSILWTVATGSGVLSNANTLTPTYTPSALDITNGFAILTLTGNPLSPCPAAAVDSVTLTIEQTPVVSAGADDNNCMSATYTVTDATSLYHTSLVWTTTGTGILINASTLTPSYTPSAADLTAGSVILTLTSSNMGCGSVSDSKTITFISMPVVDAGPDLMICEDINITIGGASAITYSSISWSTSGTGTFANGNTVSPTYTPSVADITSGLVTLTLSANPIAPCSGLVSDQTLLTISRIPVVSAGPDDLVCSTDAYVITNATSIDQDSLLWTSSGSGVFSNPTALLTTYTPSAADIANGSVSLTLTAYNSPCSSVSDSKLITIIPAPTVDAGPGATICNTCTYTVLGSSAPNANSVMWSTSGNGSFNDPTLLAPIYYPSAFDYSLGHVVLQLTAFGNTPCASVVDTMTLTFAAAPGLDFTWGPTCETQPVTFEVDPITTNIGAMASWMWNFGDGSTSIQMNPTHLYAAIGHYTVTLTAIDTLGNSITNIHQVYVSQTPTAFFAYNSPVCSNEPVHFTDLSHTLYGNVAQWVWSYGDGSDNDTIYFPENPNTLHQYDTSGQFNVTLVITNSFGCIASVTQTVDIIPAPVANFSYVNTCNGLNTQFEDQSYANGAGNVVSWWWDFGDPATGIDNYSNQENPEHKFSGPGTYQVTHVARNFNNCTDTIVKDVIILPGLAVDFIHHHTCVNDLSYFAPDTTVVNVANINSWVWDFGDGGFSYLQSPVHTYFYAGSYQVTLTVTDLSGCVSSKTKTVVVNPAPVAMFNISQQRCKGIPVEFDDVSTTYAGFISNWTWDFGDGNQESINFPANPDTEHIYTISGTYTITLTITGSDSCETVTTQTIVIEPAPTANFEFENTCINSAVQFTDLSQTGGTGAISNWHWDFGDPISNWNNFSPLQNPVHTYATAGTYQVSLTVTTSNGCESTSVQTIIINALPAVDFTRMPIVPIHRCSSIQLLL